MGGQAIHGRLSLPIAGDNMRFPWTVNDDEPWEVMAQGLKETPRGYGPSGASGVVGSHGSFLGHDCPWDDQWGYHGNRRTIRPWEAISSSA